MQLPVSVTNGGAGPYNKSALEVYGTGAFTTDPLSGFTAPMSRITVSRPGASLVGTSVAGAGAVTVAAGNLTLPGVAGALDADYLKVSGGMLNLGAATTTVAPERQDLYGYNGVSLTGNGILAMTSPGAVLSLDSTNMQVTSAAYFNAGTSTVEFVHSDFNGSNAYPQSISASANGLVLNSLRVNKPTGSGSVTVASGTVRIKETVTLPATNGVNLVTGPGNLTLLSTLTQTARIAPVLGGGANGQQLHHAAQIPSQDWLVLCQHAYNRVIRRRISGH